jgi:peptidoglycan/LPS O-acetylase OafA/YrhL
MSLRYRPEIDGLRTVAVISVLIYHAKFTAFGGDVLRGGFLGVDVFFVISGFLITSLIEKEWDQTGRFSVLSFYERRLRRLLPALFIVIFASWPVAWAILMPGQMMDFVKSQIASVFFVSNMFWWDSALTYGGRSGLVEPFLHTWSLAVEEQFYIVFPLLYICLLRFVKTRGVQMGILLSGIVLGLVLA